MSVRRTFTNNLLPVVIAPLYTESTAAGVASRPGASKVRHLTVRLSRPHETVRERMFNIVMGTHSRHHDKPLNFSRREDLELVTSGSNAGGEKGV